MRVGTRTMVAASVALLALTLSACGTTVSGSALQQAGAGGLGSAEGTGPSAVGGGAPPSNDGRIAPVAPGAASVGSTGDAAQPATGADGAPVPLPSAGGSLPSIAIGMVKTATTGAGSIGLKLDNTYTEQQFYDAIVKAYNARGGIAGRMIKPMYDEVDPLGSNWSLDFEGVCQKFTQDNHVDVVIGYVFNYDPSFESCLARKGIAHLSTTFNVPDVTELEKFPLLLNVDVPTIDRRSLAKLDGATATGVLTSKSRIGVALDTCPGTERSWNNHIRAAFTRYRLNVVTTFTAHCINGQGDSGNSAAELQNMALQFRSENVTHVFFHAVSEGPALAQFMQNANSQRWYPTYVMSSLANLMFLTTNPQLAPPEQARNVKAFGWLPFEDVTTDKYQAPDAQQKRCLQLFRSQGIKPVGSLDFKVAYTTCEVFFILELGLRASRGVSRGAELVRAVQGIGTSYASADKLGGYAVFGPRRHDVVLRARPLLWFDACSCFNYTGSVREIPQA